MFLHDIYPVKVYGKCLFGYPLFLIYKSSWFNEGCIIFGLHFVNVVS